MPIQLNLEILDQAVEVISALGGRYSTPPAHGQSPAGTHLRHVVDHYRAFLAAVDSGRVDYYARRRDPVLESDPGAMEAALIALKDDITELTGRLDDPLLVATGGPEHADGASGWAASSVRRELSFVLSHTLHHMATIAAIARTLDVPLDDSVGVAHSTLARQAATAPPGTKAG